MRNISFTLACIASLAVASSELDWSQTAAENYERLFSLCDTNVDDIISRQEHRICAETIEGTDIDAVDMYMNFMHKDLNDDQQIARDEAKFVITQTMSPPGDSWTFGEIFNYMDQRTIDGEVDWEEWLAVWESLFDDWSALELRRIFSYADSDSSGSISWQEGEDEYSNQQSYQKKFEAVAGEDGVIELAEWIAKPIFSAATASDSSIREKFSHYDINGDGKLHFMELYTNVRANQVRWSNFSKLWEQMDLGSTLDATVQEAIDGLQRVNPDISAAEATALVNTYDMSGNGEIHKLDLWAKQVREWEKEWDQENAEWNSNIEFYPHWVSYDRNLDEIATWEEIRAAREVIEDEDATRSFYDWYMQSSPAEVSNLDDTSTGMTVTTYEDGSTRTWSYVSGVKMNEDGTLFAEGIQYELAMKQWNEDNESVEEFDRIWSLVDSDSTGTITIDDLYASKDIIPDFEDADVETFWQQCMSNASTSDCTYSAACKSALDSTPWMCADETEEKGIDEYTTWREEFYATVIVIADVNLDGKLDYAEVEEAVAANSDWPTVDEIFAWNDLDASQTLTETELYAQNWIAHEMEVNAELLWTKLDPLFSGYVAKDEANLYLDWDMFLSVSGQTSIDWDSMDLNQDGWISAQEACLFTAFGYPYPSKCYSLPLGPTTEDSTTDSSQDETEEYLDFLVTWLKVDRDMDGLIAQQDLYNIRDSTTFTADQIEQEWNYLSGGVSPAPDSLSREEVYPVVQYISMMQGSFQNWFNATDYGMDGYLDDAELTSSLNQNTNVTLTAGIASISYEEACLMWFTDYTNSCYEVASTSTDGDVADEDFIKGWYEIDTDVDNSITKDQFVEYFGQEGLTAVQAGEMFDAYFPSDDAAPTVEFLVAVAKNAEIEAKQADLATVYAILNNSTMADITLNDVENMYADLTAAGIIDATADTTGYTWYDSITKADPNGAVATFDEVCAFIVDEYQCTSLVYEQAKEESAAAEADNRYDSIIWSSLAQWYRIDTDRDEMITEADLRLVRESTFTDASVTAEFNHYDTNQDGVVTKAEAWEVRKQDYDASTWWEETFSWAWAVTEGQFNGTETLPSSYEYANYTDKLFSDYDTDLNGYLYREEACKVTMGEAENVCTDISNYVDGSWVAENAQVTWYNYDTDEDEVLTQADWVLFWMSRTDEGKISEEEANADYAIIDSALNGNVTFDQTIEYIQTLYSDHSAFQTWWFTFDTSYSYSLNAAEILNSTWTQNANYTYTSEDATSWFARVDLDQNGVLERQEACSVALGRKCDTWNDINYVYINWQADYNMDGYVTFPEYARYMNQTDTKIASALYYDWYMSGLDAGVELSWNTIQQKQVKLNETFAMWADIVLSQSTDNSTFGFNESNFYNETETRMFPIASFDTTKFAAVSDWDTNADGMISDQEFCVGMIGNEVPCMDETDLEFLFVIDTNQDQQVSWDEFWTFFQTEDEEMPETGAKLMFELYDHNNDLSITREEIQLVEAAMESNTSLNMTEFTTVYLMVDTNGDMEVDRAEFSTAMNLLMLYTDAGVLDATTEESFFNAAAGYVAGEKETMDAFDVMHFVKKVVGAGMRSYIDEL